MASTPPLEPHWDELHMRFDSSTLFSALTTPTSVLVYFQADGATYSPAPPQLSAAVTLAPTAASRMSRVLVSRGQRRSARMVVTIIHETASEYFGLEGLALVHLPGEGTATIRT